MITKKKKKECMGSSRNYFGSRIMLMNKEKSTSNNERKEMRQSRFFYRFRRHVTDRNNCGPHYIWRILYSNSGLWSLCGELLVKIPRNLEGRFGIC